MALKKKAVSRSSWRTLYNLSQWFISRMISELLHNLDCVSSASPDHGMFNNFLKESTLMKIITHSVTSLHFHCKCVKVSLAVNKGWNVCSVCFVRCTASRNERLLVYNRQYFSKKNPLV